MPNVDHVLKTLKAFLQSPALKRVGKRLLVAVSGGADSVALLRAASELGPKLGWEVEALHCDHGLRAQSKAEARFVDALCQKLDVTLYAYAGGLKKGPGMEERARHWRRACYDHAALQSGARLILLAHHAQDQAETLLLNLVRGAGQVGAQGMLALGPMKEGSALLLGRPFLTLAPQELRDYLRGLKQAWKEDASNRDQAFARNRVRHGVLPHLLSVNPQAVKHLAAFASRAQAGKPQNDLAGLLKLDAKARERAQTVLAQGRGSADLGRGWTLSVGSGQAKVSQGGGAPQAEPAALRPGKALAWQGWSIQLKPAVPTARKLKDGKAFWFSKALANAAPLVRAAKPGERVAPFGLSGSKLIRDLLAEAKIPAWQRASWPVLEAGGRVVAVLGVRRGQGFEAQAGLPALALSVKTPF